MNEGEKTYVYKCTAEIPTIAVGVALKIRGGDYHKENMECIK